MLLYNFFNCSSASLAVRAPGAPLALPNPSLSFTTLRLLENFSAKLSNSAFALVLWQIMAIIVITRAAHTSTSAKLIEPINGYVDDLDIFLMFVIPLAIYTHEDGAKIVKQTREPQFGMESVGKNSERTEWRGVNANEVAEQVLKIVMPPPHRHGNCPHQSWIGAKSDRAGQCALGYRSIQVKSRRLSKTPLVDDYTELPNQLTIHLESLEWRWVLASGCKVAFNWETFFSGAFSEPIIGQSKASYVDWFDKASKQCSRSY